MSFYRSLPALLRVIVVCVLVFTIQPLHANQPLSISSDKAYTFVFSGVVLNSGNAHLLQRFIDYVAEQSRLDIQTVFVADYSKLSAMLSEQPNTMAWTCGLPYVQDQQRYGQQLVSVPVIDGSAYYYSVVIARKQEKSKNLLDFENRIFAYSDPRSHSGVLVPMHVLKNAGVEMDKHFRLLLHTGNHESSIEAVINNLADVAVVNEYVWRGYRKNFPDKAAMINVLEQYGPYPFTPLVASSKLDKNVINHIQQILSEMSQKEDGIKILTEMGLQGFVVKPKEFYEPIRTMLSETGLFIKR